MKEREHASTIDTHAALRECQKKCQANAWHKRRQAALPRRDVDASPLENLVDARAVRRYR
jgi:hypothetical protein